MNLRVDAEARDEIREAGCFYEDGRPGLGSAFLDAIEFAFTQIRKHPLTWRRFHGRFRRYLLQRFPFAVIYAIEPDCIYVAAVMHLHRQPGYWVARTKTRRPPRG